LLALLVLTRPAHIDYFHQLLGSESLPEEDIKMAITGPVVVRAADAG